MAEECGCKAEDIVLLPCSGGSNCGQIANQAAVSLDITGAGRIYCLAGLGAHIDGMVNSAGSAKRIVAIDGCPVACSKKTVEQAGLKVTDWVCVTEEGIAKSHTFDLRPEEIDLICRKTKEKLAKSPEAGI